MQIKKIILSVLKTLPIILILIFTSCYDANPLPSPSNFGSLTGQVYNLSHPGPIPIGWIPPPYEKQCTIIVLDKNRNPILVSLTDDKGKFSISIFDGSFYLRVKESPLPTESGPYDVKEGQITKAEAFYDVGMR
jgi:hypothetical protein